MLGSLCVGIVVPYTDPTLKDALETGKPGAAASPYVIAMDRLDIPVLPHIVNALILTSSFSAGNSYVYCASRSLYGLALEGKAPRVLTKCTKQGVPVYCVLVVLAIGLLSFLQVSNSAAVVLSWLVGLVTLLTIRHVELFFANITIPSLQLHKSSITLLFHSHSLHGVMLWRRKRFHWNLYLTLAC